MKVDLLHIMSLRMLFWIDKSHGCLKVCVKFKRRYSFLYIKKEKIEKKRKKRNRGLTRKLFPLDNVQNYTWTANRRGVFIQLLLLPLEIHGYKYNKFL